MAHDIREIRPTELHDAIALLGGEPLESESVERPLSIALFDDEGTLQGVVVHQCHEDGSRELHVHTTETADADTSSESNSRQLVNRAIAKATANGLRATRVTFHPETAADAVWVPTAWPGRERTPNPNPIPADNAPAADPEAAEEATGTEAAGTAEAA